MEGLETHTGKATAREGGGRGKGDGGREKGEGGRGKRGKRLAVTADQRLVRYRYGRGSAGRRYSIRKPKSPHAHTPKSPLVFGGVGG